MKKNRLIAFLSIALVLPALACSALFNGTEQQPSGEPVTEESAPEPAVPTLRSDRPSTPALCADSQSAWVTNFDVFPEPSIPEPEPRLPFRDPVFGSCLVRVTDRNNDLSPDDSSGGLKNEYSRIQSYNADETRFIVRGTAATWYLYDAQSLQPLGQLPIEVDPRWSADNPNLVYYSSGTSLMSHDIQSGQQATVHDFANDFPGQSLSVVWARSKGSPSVDGRYWGMMAEDENWLTSGLVVYDIVSDAVVATLDIRGWSEETREIDNVTISPLGNYFLADLNKYCERGSLGTEQDPCGFMVYDRNLQNGRGLLRLVGHGDTALDAQGREVMVFQDVDTDNISMLDLESGSVTPLWSIDFSHTPIGLHISGRAFLLPGWVLVSTHDGDPSSYTWMDDSVFAVELKPNGRVVRLAHTHSLVDENMEHDYWAEPQASVNHDFTRILFTTNWGHSGTEQVETYLVILPENWIDLLP
jgi:hypothetical protein